MREPVYAIANDVPLWYYAAAIGAVRLLRSKLTYVYYTKR